MKQKSAAAKPAILMVHGAFGGGWAFENFQEYLETRGYHCLTPDLRHHAPSGGRASGQDLARTSLLHYLSDLEALIDGHEGEIVLMGHSMGGLLCQMLAARGHGARMVLLASSPPAGIFPASSMEMLTSFGVFASGMGWGQSSLAPDRATASQYAMSHIPDLPKKTILDRLSPESGYALFEIMCWMMDPQQASRVDASRVACPVLSIAGSHDTINAPDTVRQIARRYGAQSDYHCFDAVGHWLLDGPKWRDIAEHCADWLDGALNIGRGNQASLEKSGN